MKRPLTVVVLIILIAFIAGNGVASAPARHDTSKSAQLSATIPLATTSGYALVAWSELGMHCIDGKDYSIFSVLPPYNTIHAQLIKTSEPPTLVTSGVTITYQSTADTKGSVNSSSASKTNFWSYVTTLFLANVPPETGLTGNRTQSTTPQPMTYNPTEGYWEAVGIPRSLMTIREFSIRIPWRRSSRKI